MSSNSTLCTGAAIGAVVLATALPVEAQINSAVQQPALEAASATSTGIADIVVTAQKRSQNLQKTPVAVSTFSG